MQSTPAKDSVDVFPYDVEQETPDGGLPPIPDSPAKTKPDPTKVDLATATVEELFPYCNHYSLLEDWNPAFSTYIKTILNGADVIGYVRYVLASRLTNATAFNKIISSPATITDQRTHGELRIGPVNVTQMLHDDYRGNYPHFLLVAARKFILVQYYPNEDFLWNQGTPAITDDRLIVYPWAQSYKRLAQAANYYYWQTKSFRDALFPIPNISTADLNRNTHNLTTLTSELPTPLFENKFLQNLQDSVYMGFSDEAKAYLHRFLVRCDHEVGLSVSQFRQYFIEYFINLRKLTNDEDTIEWYISAENLWSAVQVHLT